MIVRRRVLTGAAAGTAVLYGTYDMALHHPGALAARWAAVVVAAAVAVALRWLPRRPPAHRTVLFRVLAFLGGWAGSALALLMLLAAAFVPSLTWVGLLALVAAISVGYGWLAEILTFWMLAALVAPRAVAAYVTVRDVQGLSRDVRDVREMTRRRKT